jgi:Ca2+-binding EF-hand superfamily protein
MESVDYEGNGKINYTEFLSATISIKSVLTYEKLWALFKHFDTDDSGTITKDNLKQAFGNAGRKLTDKDMKEIMKEHDIENNGVLSFDEFKAIFEGKGVTHTEIRSNNASFKC